MIEEFKPIPLDVPHPPYGDPLAQTVAILQERSRESQALFRDVALPDIAMEYGQGSAQYITAYIFSELSDTADKFFIEQYQQGTVEYPRSWESYGEAALACINKLDEVLADKQYQQFFQDHPLQKNIFELVRDLYTISDSARLKELTAQIVRYALEANNRGEWVILPALSQFYTVASKDNSESVRTLEMDLRLCIPLRLEVKVWYEQIHEDISTRLDRLYPDRIVDTDLFAGSVVGLAGAQRYSAGYAECLPPTTIFLATNLFKAIDEARNLAHRLHISFDEDHVTRCLSILYLAHEGSHVRKDDPKQKVLTEVIHDVACLIVGLEFDQTEEMLLAILAEFIALAGDDQSENETLDSYRLSGIFIINSLVESGVVRVEGDNIHFNLEPERIEHLTQKLRSAHARLVTEEDMIVADVALGIPRSETHALIELFKQKQV